MLQVKQNSIIFENIFSWRTAKAQDNPRYDSCNENTAFPFFTMLEFLSVWKVFNTGGGDDLWTGFLEGTQLKSVR